MNEKITATMLAGMLSKQANCTKRMANSFIQHFSEAIEEGLQSDGVVKVTGFGTFKISNVGPRESVNVTNGERIVIPAFNRIGFTANDTIEPAQPAIQAATEAAPTVEETEVPEPPATLGPRTSPSALPQTSPSASSTPKKTQTSETGNSPGPIPFPHYRGAETSNFNNAIILEEPMDDFSGIDVLISTPESIDELEQKLAEARSGMAEKKEELQQANQAVEEAKEQARRAERKVMEVRTEYESAHSLVEKYEQLLDNALSNRKVEMAGKKSAPNLVLDKPGQADADKTVGAPETQKKQAAVKEKGSRSYRWLWYALCALLLAAIAATLGPLARPRTSPSALPKTTQGPRTSPSASSKASPGQRQMSEPARPVPTKQAEPVRKKTERPVPPVRKEDASQLQETSIPKTHVLKRGESLTKLSVIYYNTKDSVGAIIRANNFSNPDNIPVGAEIHLP